MEPLSCTVRRGDRVFLNARKHDIWVLRTAADIAELRARDAAAGRWHDDGGEPILYGPYKSWPHKPDGTLKTLTLALVVTSCRPQWVGYHRRPKGLRAGWSEKLKCEVLFRSL
jgi:hypothetical protein